MSFLRRFQSKVDRRLPHECWPWLAATSRGYGVFWMDGKQRRAHRVAFEIAHGSIKKNLCVCHTCDNPTCCNPAHLFLGTNEENTADKVAKGRQAVGTATRPETRARGERQHLHKLTAQAVKTIRNGEMSTGSLALLFGVSTSTVRRVIRGETWKHIEAAPNLALPSSGDSEAKEAAQAAAAG